MPDRIDGVALICPAILPDIEKRTVPEHVVLVKDDRLLSHLTAEEAEDFNESAVVQSETIYERYKKEVMSGVEIANSEFLQTLRKNRYGFSFNVDQSKRKFQKPSVIMVGRQDSCVGYRDAWAILKNFPRATFAVLDGAGHNLQIEQQMLFNSLMKEWLIRVSQS
jgi:pimeloyl-ACP methyl ester carboxylesterase